MTSNNPPRDKYSLRFLSREKGDKCHLVSRSVSRTLWNLKAFLHIVFFLLLQHSWIKKSFFMSKLSQVSLQKKLISCCNFISNKLFNQIRKYDKIPYVHYIKRPVLFITRLGVARSVPKQLTHWCFFLNETLSFFNTRQL